MPGATAKRVVQSFTLHLDAEPERVFPLLCPVREYDWLHGWSCRLVHCPSGAVEEGCVFVTESAPEGRTIWVAVRHDPAARRVQYLRTSPDSHVARMSAAVDADPAGGSTLRLEHAFTALGERGEALLRALEAGALAARTAWLGRAIEHHLRTGGVLVPEGVAR
jgi:hypothetical protein